MESTAYSGASLEEVLKGSALAQSGLSLVGMVKPSESEGYIRFTRAGCDNWIEIPTDMIERAEQVGQSPCKDHSHPVYRITLTTPKDPQSEILAALLAQSPQQSGMSTSQLQGSMTPMPRMQGGMSPMSHMPMGVQTTSKSSGTGQQGPTFQGGQSVRLGNPGGFPGGGGTRNAWGCWDSACTTCIQENYVCNGSACWWVCVVWTEEPCERCIWPW